ncbi:hypothetical protein [Alienimonas chondri]|uniref:Uncharacterized protein n=1 Tax=Alienimonas chondri TaxID=2681879 RepID=A0ABX1VGJ1_9PLAN|nr:hypothetical protein [Alienimonas chondri]NNJ27249.1 hypothetical protein [Alienimonas chondri]
MSRLALSAGLAALLIVPPAFAVDDPAEQWVAVGYGGRRMVSEDGIRWEITEEWAVDGKDDSNNLMSLARGRGIYVAVGGGGWSRDTQAGHILVSEDGRTWREVHKAPNRVNPVVYGANAGPDGAGRFVAGGPNRTLLWSDDAETWTPGAQIPADDFPDWAMWFRHGAYGNGTFVFMGEGGKNKDFYWCVNTKDGEEARFRRDLPHLKGLAFGAGRFVAVGPGVIATSKDGWEWTTQSRPEEDKLSWIVWTGEEFLCGGGKQSYASADGLEWRPHPVRPRGHLKWSDGERFISSGWPGKMFYSTDGTKWEQAPEMTPNGINKVVRGASPAE